MLISSSAQWPTVSVYAPDYQYMKEMGYLVSSESGVKINMLMIESRPIEGRSWEYRFFVDVEGSLGDAAMQNALAGIQAEAAALRILGNY